MTTELNIEKELRILCSAKNIEGNITDPSKRVVCICDCLKRNGIDYYVDRFLDRYGRAYHNIIVPGDGKVAISCHHDVVNTESDNCNDDSGSIINSIYMKLKCPELKLFILDGEENLGVGSAHLAEQITRGEHGAVDTIANLELTSIGGVDGFVEDAETELRDRVVSQFDHLESYKPPFSDSHIFRDYGLNSVTLNTLPRNEDGTLDYSILWRCHSLEDSIDKADFKGMKQFCDEILTPLVESYR